LYFALLPVITMITACSIAIFSSPHSNTPPPVPRLHMKHMYQRC
jgi:hypothetical protein